jgi:iron complex outermembrane receptor protein
MGSKKSAWGAAALVVAAMTGECTLGQAQQRVTATSGVADRAAVRFSIPAQPLAPALASFGNAAVLQILYAADVARNMRTNGVQGTFSRAEALRRLLAGTGLVYRFTNAGTVTIEPSGSRADTAPVPGAIALDTIDVQGAANPNSTMSLPPVYAGGQVASGGRVGLLGNRSIFDIPFSQTNYTEQLMRDQQVRSIYDVFENNPAVRPESSPYNFQQAVSVRGFTLNSRDYAFDGLYGLTNVRRPQLEGVARVEVLNGPATFLYGFPPSGASGGLVNLIPKRATDDPIARLTANYLSRGNGGLAFDVGQRYGDQKEFGVRINGTGSAGPTPIDKNELAIGSLTAGLDYRGQDFRASLDAGMSHQAYKAPVTGLSPRANNFPIGPAPGLTSNFQQPWADFKFNHRFAVGRVEYDITNDWTLFGAYGAAHQDERYISTSNALNNTAGDITQSTYATRESALAQSGEVGVRGKVWTGPVKHSVSLVYTGYRNESLWGSVSTDVFANNIYAPVNFPAPDRAAQLATVQQTKSNLLLTGIALIDTMSVADDRVQFSIGGRRQHLETNYYDVNGLLTPGDSQDANTPMLALLFKPWQPLTFYMSYAEGFGFGPQAPQEAANSRVFLGPQRTKQIETGAKVDFGRFGATLAFYRISQPSAFLNPGTNIFGYNGEQRNEGIDFTMFGSPVENVRLLGGVTFLDGRLTKTLNGVYDGKSAPGVSNVQLSVGAEYDVPWIPNFTVTGRVVHMSDNFLDRANFQRVGGWERLDLGARYKFRAWDRDMVARLNVDNAIGKNYWYASTFGQLILGVPQTFRLSLSADLLPSPTTPVAPMYRK